ncbi:hypothetical protein F5B20DRAFT_545942 [Whalleya microplaca]|nr:hypothetical protein F5B20DRAFT_545942 [Whalleya microplaca]
MMVDHDKIPVYQIGEIVVQIRLGIVLPNNLWFEAGNASVPVPNSNSQVSEPNVQDYGEWAMLESEANSREPWEAVLLPVYDKEKENKLDQSEGDFYDDRLESCQRGDLVYICPSMAKAGRRTKKMPRHLEGYVLGPYEIMGVYKDSFSLDMPQNLKVFPVVHKSFLTKHVQGPSEATSQMQKAPRIVPNPGQTLSWDSPTPTLGQVTQEPKRILNVELRKEVYYYVQVGAKDPAWYHASWLQSSLAELNEFHAANPSEIKPQYYVEYLKPAKKGRPSLRRVCTRALRQINH